LVDQLIGRKTNGLPLAKYHLLTCQLINTSLPINQLLINFPSRQSAKQISRGVLQGGDACFNGRPCQQFNSQKQWLFSQKTSWFHRIFRLSSEKL
jgi:hypothetical protein